MSVDVNLNGISVLTFSSGVTSATTVNDTTTIAGLGSGSVTSFSAGNLSPLFTTNVATATTTPALTFLLSNAAGGTVFGNNTASSAAPAYTSVPVLGINASVRGTLGLATDAGSGATITVQNLGCTSAYNFNLPTTAGAAGTVLTSQGGGSSSMTWTTPSTTLAWSSLTNATANLTLANAGFTTTFNQTSAVNWTWANTTAAVSGTAQSSPAIILTGSEWDGAAAQTDTWTIQNVCANSTTVRGSSELKILHSGGTSGATNVFDVGVVTFTNGVTGGPFVQGGLGFDGTKNTNSSTPAIFGAITSSVFALVPSGSTSVNVGCNLRFYENAATTTNSLNWEIATAANNGGAADCSIIASRNANGQGLNLYCAVGTSARTGILLGGNGAGNAKNFSATAGTQVGVSCGNGGAATQGSLTFNPASGNAAFVGLQVNPTINVTGAASGGKYTALKVNVVETSLTGMSGNLLLDLQAGVTGGTSEFAIDSTGKVTQYTATATVSNGIPSEIAVVDLTAQSAAIAATNLIASAPSSAMYRISWTGAITTAATTSSVLGGTNGFQIKYTSPTDSVVKTTIAGNSFTSNANTTGTATGNSIVIYAKTGTAIQYSYDYTSVGGTAMVYELHIKLEVM